MFGLTLFPRLLRYRRIPTVTNAVSRQVKLVSCNTVGIDTTNLTTFHVLLNVYLKVRDTHTWASAIYELLIPTDIRINTSIISKGYFLLLVNNHKKRFFLVYLGNEQTNMANPNDAGLGNTKRFVFSYQYTSYETIDGILNTKWRLGCFVHSDDFFNNDTSSPSENDPDLDECPQNDRPGETIEYHPHHWALGFAETPVFRGDVEIVVRVKTKKEGLVQKSDRINSDRWIE